MQVLRKLLFPISILYGVVVHIRNYLYDIGLFKSNTFETPTICVGNLSVGGTGKTPMIEFLIRSLQNDFQLAVLSRGYRRKSNGFQLAGKASTVEQLGDEPFQIYKKFDEITLAVDANRTNGIRNLEKMAKPDIILLDDAFQHRKVQASLNILLTAHDNLYSTDVFLPTGSLRDAKKQADRANIVVVTKCPEQLTTKDMSVIKKTMGRHENVFFTMLSYGEKLRSASRHIAFSALIGKKISLVTGIANPKPLISHLKSLGILFRHFEFKDHHFFSENDIAKFGDSDYIITTEKDYVRLEGKVGNLFYLEVRHQFLNGDGSAFISLLLEMIRRHPQSLS